MRQNNQRIARMTALTSGEGAAISDTQRKTTGAVVKVQKRDTLAGQLLRHNLITPEKKTLKRIDALRALLRNGVDENGTPVHKDHTMARIHEHLRCDRGLAAALEDAHYQALTAGLSDDSALKVTAATIVGDYLRTHGAIERSSKTPERIKQAHVVVADALYDLDNPYGGIAQLLRDVKVEKRDGGLQLVAFLRQQADEAIALAAVRNVLDEHGFTDVDVRAERPAPVVAKMKTATRSQAPRYASH